MTDPVLRHTALAVVNAWATLYPQAALALGDEPGWPALATSIADLRRALGTADLAEMERKR